MTDKMREDFEKWAMNHYWLQEFGPERSVDNPNEMDEYVDAEVQLAWEAWKASRDSLVIELPKPEDINKHASRSETALAFIDKILSQGLHIK